MSNSNTSMLPRGSCCRQVEDGEAARLFRALADPTRVAILARLADAGRPATVSEVGCCTDVDLSVVSRHLRQLREAGIVRAERRGKEVRYEVCYGEVIQMLRSLANLIEQCCPR